MAVLSAVNTCLYYLSVELVTVESQATLSNSKPLGDYNSFRIAKSSNYRDWSYRGFLLGDFQGT